MGCCNTTGHSDPHEDLLQTRDRALPGVHIDRQDAESNEDEPGMQFVNIGPGNQ